MGANLSLINSAVDIAPDELALIRVSGPGAPTPARCLLNRLIWSMPF
ncbi:MAG: hypothetical protein IPL33_18425 [Sphingobacteriales bacterium]|nr:hypothetical protein [Sphingobacteriales bacterium]